MIDGDQATVIEDAITPQLKGCHTGSKRLKCPSCGPERKNQRATTLAVRIEEDHAVYMCHHCDAKGRLNFDLDDHREVVDLETEVQPVFGPNSNTDTVSFQAPKTLVSLDPDNFPNGKTLEDKHLAWLNKRAIGDKTLSDFGVLSGDIYIPDRDAVVPCVGFPYRHEDGSVAVKWRDGLKNWSQSGSAKTLWGVERFTGGDLVITEGEMDALSYGEAGVFAVSAPNGAPKEQSKPGNDIVKYNYLYESLERLKLATKVIIATDADKPGQYLAEEIARRVGIGKCWRVSYPEGCKDANDVLVQYGPEELRKTLTRATPWPVSGIRDVNEFRDKALDLYHNGMDRGTKVGIYDLDRIYTATPSSFTLVTGIPGNGKSAFLTWLSVRLAVQSGWQSVVLSAEMPSEIHLLEMAAVHSGKPYEGHNKMSLPELEASMDWVQNHFTFLDDNDTDIKSVLERASVSIMRYGARILIIDPYNFLTSEGTAEDNHQSINRLLVNLKRFSREHDIAVFLVAHPKKMMRGSDGRVTPPGGYDVSGSASFFNTVDAGLTVARGDEGTSTITNWKARFRWIGKLGSCTLAFDEKTGTFSGIPVPGVAWGKTAQVLTGGLDAEQAQEEGFDFGDV